MQNTSLFLAHGHTTCVNQGLTLSTASIVKQYFYLRLEPFTLTSSSPCWNLPSLQRRSGLVITLFGYSFEDLEGTGVYHITSDLWLDWRYKEIKINGYTCPVLGSNVQCVFVCSFLNKIRDMIHGWILCMFKPNITITQWSISNPLQDS